MIRIDIVWSSISLEAVKEAVVGCVRTVMASGAVSDWVADHAVTVASASAWTRDENFRTVSIIKYLYGAEGRG